MKNYLVQAILCDGQSERVINSCKTDNYKSVIDTFMIRHKNSNKYLYIAMDLDNQEIVFKSERNKYY